MINKIIKATCISFLLTSSLTAKDIDTAKVMEMVKNKLNLAISSSKTSVASTIEGYYSDLEIITPYIHQLGYEVARIDLEITLAPKVAVLLNRHTVVSLKDQEAVIEYCKFQGLSTTILTAIVEVSKIQDTIKLGDFKVKEIQLDLGIVPSATLKYYPLKTQ